MHTRNLWPALLLVAAAACSEGGSPVDTPWERAFDIAVPSFRQLSTVTPEATAPESPDSVAASYSYDPADLPSEFAQVLATGRLITEPSAADAGFAGDHMVAYGQALGRSRGSYYRNNVKLKLFYRGAAVSENEGETMASCLCAHLWSPWGAIANTTIGVGSECGHMAQANSRHDARLDFTTPVKVFTLLAESATDSDQAYQPACGVASHDGGGSDGDWYICYWEDIYSETGVFLRRNELGCSPYNGHVY
jgi:hypothetical protein